MTPKLHRLLLLALALQAFANSALAVFTDVSGEDGIESVHSLRADGAGNIAGSAAVDVNGDGLTDLLFANYDSSPKLYMNKGGGLFEDETQARGLSDAVDAASFGAGDFDNDGDLDLFIAPHFGSRFLLYINDGSGHFSEEAIERGADIPTSQSLHRGYSIGLVDYNLDGYLDVYVSEWDVIQPADLTLHNVLLRNRGAEAPGSFENVTLQAGLLQSDANQAQSGFSTAWADFDGDGWPDLALVSDFGKSKMYWNDGDGTFTETTEASGLGLDENGMGVAVADYDGDGLLDLYITSIYDDFRNPFDTGNKLYRNLGGRKFEEVAVQSGVDNGGWGWGASFFEYDNDGDFDIVTTNGHTISEGLDPETNSFVAAVTDPTTLFVNNGSGSFSNGTLESGISDTRLGKAVVVLDYDNDGDEDIVIVNSHSNPILYQSDASENGNDWLRLTFEGTISNRDGIGAIVKLTEGGRIKALAYNPSMAYAGQREAALHFGLGDSDGVVDSLEIKWPTGIVQTLTDIAANQVLHLVEPDDVPLAPFFSLQPMVEGPFQLGDSLLLKAAATGIPAPVFVWKKDGETIEGASGNELLVKSLAPFDEGVYQAVAINSGGEALSVEVTVEIDIDMASRSVARWWNEFMLEAIRRDFPDPTKHSRNLYHVSAAMWDAFWPYQQEQWTMAAPVFHKEEISFAAWGQDREAAQSEAISHAAYTVLTRRYQTSPGAESSLFGFRWLMERLGYDPDFSSLEGDSPAAVGNRIGNSTLETNYSDGSNELEDYADTSGYQPVNDPLPVALSGTQVVDINHWQPLLFENAISQNGIPIGQLVQTFLGVNWREVDTFALRKTSSNTIAFDPGSPPQFGGDMRNEFIDATVEVIRYSSLLDPDDGEIIDISPGARLNNTVDPADLRL